MNPIHPILARIFSNLHPRPHIRYRTKPRGEEALGHLQELEKLIVEAGEEGVA